MISTVRKPGLKTAQPLFDEPNSLAARKVILAAGQQINPVIVFIIITFPMKRQMAGFLKKNYSDR